MKVYFEIQPHSDIIYMFNAFFSPFNLDIYTIQHQYRRKVDVTPELSHVWATDGGIQELGAIGISPRGKAVFN